MSDKNYKKCSKCNIGHNQDYHKDFGYTCPNEVEKQRRIFAKSGKHFCFNCLTSEYNVSCHYCHKQINSKDELAYWSGGVLSINEDYDYCKADDRVFMCWSCDKKIREEVKNGVKPSMCSGWGPTLFPENRKCRIAGCSQKPYYECVDLCLPHSKPCKGGKIKPDGKRCNAAMGTDEGNICEFCQNQTEVSAIKGDKNNSHSSNPEALVSIDNKNNQNDNSVSSSNSPQPNEPRKRENDNEKILTNPTSEKSPNKDDNKTPTINFVLDSVKKITLTSKGDLVIEFNSSMSQTISITPNQINNNQELQKVNNYLKKNNQTSLNQQELTNLLQTKKNNNRSLSRDKSPQNYQNLWIGLGIGGTLIIGIIAGLLIKKKKIK